MAVRFARGLLLTFCLVLLLSGDSSSSRAHMGTRGSVGSLPPGKGDEIVCETWCDGLCVQVGNDYASSEAPRDHSRGDLAPMPVHTCMCGSGKFGDRCLDAKEPTEKQASKPVVPWPAEAAAKVTYCVVAEPVRGWIKQRAPGAEKSSGLRALSQTVTEAIAQVSRSHRHFLTASMKSLVSAAATAWKGACSINFVDLTDSCEKDPKYSPMVMFVLAAEGYVFEAEDESILQAVTTEAPNLSKKKKRKLLWQVSNLLQGNLGPVALYAPKQGRGDAPQNNDPFVGVEGPSSDKAARRVTIRPWKFEGVANAYTAIHKAIGAVSSVSGNDPSASARSCSSQYGPNTQHISPTAPQWLSRHTDIRVGGRSGNGVILKEVSLATPANSVVVFDFDADSGSGSGKEAPVSVCAGPPPEQPSSVVPRVPIVVNLYLGGAPARMVCVSHYHPQRNCVDPLRVQSMERECSILAGENFPPRVTAEVFATPYEGKEITLGIRASGVAVVAKYNTVMQENFVDHTTLKPDSRGYDTLHPDVCNTANARETLKLNLDNNGLVELGTSLRNCTAIVDLSAKGNALSSIPFNALSDLAMLHRLDLSNNLLWSLLRDDDAQEDGPDETAVNAALSFVADVNLSDNLFTSIPSIVAAFESLVALTMRNNRITSIPDWVGEMPSLRHLRLSGNPIRSLPESLGTSQQLATLDLRNVATLSWVPHSLGCLQTLSRFITAGTNLTEFFKAKGFEGKDAALSFVKGTPCLPPAPPKHPPPVYAYTAMVRTRDRNNPDKDEYKRVSFDSHLGVLKEDVFSNAGRWGRVVLRSKKITCNGNKGTQITQERLSQTASKARCTSSLTKLTTGCPLGATVNPEVITYTYNGTYSFNGEKSFLYTMTIHYKGMVISAGDMYVSAYDPRIIKGYMTEDEAIYYEQFNAGPPNPSALRMLCKTKNQIDDDEWQAAGMKLMTPT